MVTSKGRLGLARWTSYEYEFGQVRDGELGGEREKVRCGE